MNDRIRVEVAYATEARQYVETVEVGAGVTVETAIRASSVLAVFPEIDLKRHAVGVFGKRCTLETKVAFGDRVEIYRPLLIDPKDARRAKAKKR